MARLATNARVLARRTPNKPSAVDQTTRENIGIAKKVDVLRGLDTEALLKKRAEVASQLAIPGNERGGLVNLSEAILFAGHENDPHFAAHAPHGATKGGVRRLLFEHLITALRSVDHGLSYKGMSSIDADWTQQHDLIRADADELGREFTRQARENAIRILDASLISIEEMLRSYGLPPMVFTAVARVHSGSSTVGQESADWLRLAKNEDHRAAYQAGATHRTRLKEWATAMRRLQLEITSLKQKQQDLAEPFGTGEGSHAPVVETTPGVYAPETDPIREVEGQLESTRKKLEATWAQGEAFHPILGDYRTRSGEQLESIDLSILATGDDDARMQELLARVLPKLVDIRKAKGMLTDQARGISPLKLPEIVKLTRAAMFISPGSLGDAEVNDLVADASGGGPIGWLIDKIIWALAIITAIPTGGASLALPAALLASLELYKAGEAYVEYGKEAILADTALDRAHALIHEEPALADVLMRVAEAGLDATMVAHVFTEALKLRKLALAGEETSKEARALVTSLNKLEDKNVGRIGDDVLNEVHTEEVAGKGAAKAPEPPEAGAPPEAGKAPPSKKAPDKVEERPDKTPVSSQKPPKKEPTKGKSPPSESDPETAGKGAGKPGKGSVPELPYPPGAPILSVAELRKEIRQAIEKLTGYGGTNSNTEWVSLKKAIRALSKQDRKANKELLALIDKVYAAVRSPEYIEAVAVDVWETARREQISITDALKQMAGDDLPVLPSKGVSDAEFRDLIREDKPFVDLQSAKDFHGAYSHAFQELLVAKALGGRAAAARFRRLIAEAVGPLVKLDVDGRVVEKEFWSAVWDSIFDSLQRGQINRPEDLGQILHTELGVEGPRRRP